eukprot:m.392935 g.392935  ORF g.392935 m.392935 type:complete len:257 (+) comp20088_c6_seq1:125-895(+)
MKVSQIAVVVAALLACALAAPSSLRVRRAGGYTLSKNTATYEDAAAACAKDGGTLAVVDSAAENDALVKEYDGPFWIGLRRSPEDNKFVWDDGTEKDFVSFAKGEPNSGRETEKSCVIFTSKGWSDVKCEKSYKYLCEGASEGDDDDDESSSTSTSTSTSSSSGSPCGPSLLSGKSSSGSPTSGPSTWSSASGVAWLSPSVSCENVLRVRFRKNAKYWAAAKVRQRNPLRKEAARGVASAGVSGSTTYDDLNTRLD